MSNTKINRNRVLHLRSLNTEGEIGKLHAKLPTADQIDYGEIAMNYREGYETLIIKNNNDGIVTFPTTEQVGDIVDKKVETITNDDLDEIFNTTK